LQEFNAIEADGFFGACDIVVEEEEGAQGPFPGWCRCSYKADDSFSYFQHYQRCR